MVNIKQWTKNMVVWAGMLSVSAQMTSNSGMTTTDKVYCHQPHTHISHWEKVATQPAFKEGISKSKLVFYNDKNVSTLEIKNLANDHVMH